MAQGDNGKLAWIFPPFVLRKKRVLLRGNNREEALASQRGKSLSMTAF